MGEEEITYDADVALNLLADRLAKEVHDNAILRASVNYYRGLVTQLQEARTFATVPFTEKAG